MTIWEVLGIDATVDARDIKRDYARKLKVTRPDDDPTAFQLLNDAFQHAQAYARHHAHEEVAAPAPAPEPELDEAVVESVAAPAPVRMARPVAPPPAGPSAAEQASTLWAGFIATSTVQPRMHLTRLAASDALLNLDVREEFELCAARYCASDACSHDLREAIAAHFRWETEHALIARAVPRETQMLFAQLRAEQSYAMFLQHQSSDPAVAALLAERPGMAWMKTCDANFMGKMRQLLPAIREHHAEMLHFKLDQQRFADWESRVARKRYYVQTALYSVIATIAVGLLFALVLASLEAPDSWSGPAIMASIVIGFGGFAWYAFSPARGGRPFRETALGGRVHQLLHDVRYRPRWQFGWLAPFALASTAMFLPHPPLFVQYLVAATLAVCVLAASFASSAVVNGITFFIAIAVSVGLGPALANGAFAFHPIICTMLAYCGFMMLIRGGSDLLGMSPVPPTAITPLRAGWLTGMVALVAGAQLALSIPASYTAFCWVWLLAGMLLMRPSIHFLFALLGAVAFQGIIASAVPKPSLLTLQPMSQVLAGLLFVTVFMTVNMVRARSTQHPFS